MAIAFVNLGASATPDIVTNTDLASYPTASWTPPTTGLIILFAGNTQTSVAAAAVSSVTGNSLTWNVIATATFGASSIRRITLIGADATGATTGATTINYGGVTQTGFIGEFFQATGVDLSGGVSLGGSGVFVQAPVVNAGASAMSGSVTLAAASAADNRPISCFSSATNEVMTPRASWTEMDDMGGTAPTRNMECQSRTDAFEATASASWATSGVWGAIAAELKATAAATTSLLWTPPMSNPTVYLR